MPEHIHDTIGAKRFEKNNYFYGKLLTVRDMAAEQAYHSDIQRTLSRYVTDWGVVCGLDVTSNVVTDDETGQDSLEVLVSEGLALDRCGRLLSVSEEYQHHETLPATVEGVETDTVSVYVEYDECFTDRVPAAKMENACDEDCEDNRIVEEAGVIVEPGDPGDYHKSIADVDFPTADDLGIAGDSAPQMLDMLGDLLIQDADFEVPDTVRVELTLSESAPSDSVVVDISPTQTGDEDTIVGTLEVPLDSVVGPDGYQLPEGEFSVSGRLGEESSQLAVGGSLSAEPNGGTVSFEGTITVQGQNLPLEFPLNFDFNVNDDLSFEGNILHEDAMWLIDGNLLWELHDDDTYVLTGSTDVSVREEEVERELGTIETPEWENELGEEIDGLLLDRPVVEEAPDEVDINLDEILSRPARSYYENEPRGECPPTSRDRILVGTITRDGENWTTASFEYGPLVYTNDLLYDVFINHASDFENPHNSIASIEGVGPDSDGNIDIRTDESISVTTGPHSLSLSATGSGPSGLPESYQEYLLERSLLWGYRTYRDLASRVDLPQAGDLADLMEQYHRSWEAGRVEYLAAFQSRNALHSEQQNFLGDLQEGEFDFLDGVNIYRHAVERLVAVIGSDPTALEAAIAQLRVCEAAACLRGKCFSFGVFPVEVDELSTPFTYGEYLVDSRAQLGVRETDAGTFLELPHEEVHIAFPTTSAVQLEMISEDWEETALRIFGFDSSNNEITIFSGNGEQSWGRTQTFSREEDDLTRVSIAQAADVTANLTRLCHR